MFKQRRVFHSSLCWKTEVQATVSSQKALVVVLVSANARLRTFAGPDAFPLCAFDGGSRVRYVNDDVIVVSASCSGLKKMHGGSEVLDHVVAVLNTATGVLAHFSNSRLFLIHVLDSF